MQDAWFRLVSKPMSAPPCFGVLPGRLKSREDAQGHYERQPGIRHVCHSRSTADDSMPSIEPKHSAPARDQGPARPTSDTAHHRMLSDHRGNWNLAARRGLPAYRRGRGLRDRGEMGTAGSEDQGRRRVGAVSVWSRHCCT